MGDKILKKYLLFILLSSFVLANQIQPKPKANIENTSIKKLQKELQWVDKQIEAIKPPRKGVAYRAISYLKDPFVFLEKNKTKKEKKTQTFKTAPSVVPTSITNSVGKQKVVSKKKILKLKAIMNNSALINDKWYKVGEVVNGYTITKVTLTEVLLKKGSKSITLTTYTKKFKR